MPNTRLSLEIVANGAAQTIGEIKRVRKALADSGGETQKLEKTNASYSGGVQALAAKYFLVTQAIQTLVSIATPAYEALIGQNAKLQQQLIGTQSTLAATNDVFANGVKIQDPTEAIKALEGPVNEAIAKIRKGSLELVGVTSKDLVDAFQIVAGEAGNVGINLDQAADLTLSFSAALGTLGIPLFQARQEIGSILRGQIDQNSVLAKSIGLNNQQVQELKAQGKLYDFLNQRLEAFRAGNKLSAQTIGGVTSNIQELFDEITRAAGEPLMEPLIEALDDVYKFLNQNKDAIIQFATEGVDKFLELVEIVTATGSEIGSNLQPVIKELAQIFDEDLARALENILIGISKFAILATDLLVNNPAVKLFLDVVDAAVTAVAAISSLNGEFGASTEAAEIYRQQSAGVAQQAVDALGKIQRGEADAAKARTEAIATVEDQIKNLKDANLVGSENRAVINAQIDELENYKKQLSGVSDNIKIVSKNQEEQTKKLQEAAQKEAEILKGKRETEKTKNQEQFDEKSRDRQSKFDEKKRTADEKFQRLQEATDEKFQAISQERDRQFQTQQNQAQEQFQTKQQSDQQQFQTQQNQAQEQFQAKQQAAEKQFNDEQAAQRDRTATAFSAAQASASQAEQLASAQSAEERSKLAAEFKRQAQQQQAISKLQLADREFNPNQILNLAKQVSGANLQTAEGAKAVSGAIAAIQAEQQKQQEAADLKAKLTFEKQIQAEKQTFELGQQEAAKTFTIQQQEAAKAFTVGQQQAAQAFQEQQQQQDKAYRDFQREVDKTLAEFERTTQQQFEEEERSRKKAFADDQRSADLANAEEIKKILESVKGSGVAVTPRRSGGPVAPGEPYLVGEEGPELIVPRSPGQVMTARETAALMKVGSPSLSVPSRVSVQTDTSALETRLDRLVQINQDLAQRLLLQRANTFSQTNYYNSSRTGVLRGSGL